MSQNYLTQGMREMGLFHQLQPVLVEAAVKEPEFPVTSRLLGEGAKQALVARYMQVLAVRSWGAFPTVMRARG